MRALVGVLLAVSLPASAVGPAGPAGPSPCDSDAARLCPNRYNGALAACLISQRMHLSPQCASMLEPFIPCAAELAALCPDVPPGEGRLVECLRLRRNDVSQECRSALGSLPR